jgi:hypothetical protein
MLVWQYGNMEFNMSDIKLYALNVTSLALSFSHIDMALKILLLIISVGYTAQKWYLLDKDRRDRKKK